MHKLIDQKSIHKYLNIYIHNYFQIHFELAVQIILNKFSLAKN
jgi:hypothetical protein